MSRYLLCFDTYDPPQNLLYTNHINKFLRQTNKSPFWQASCYLPTFSGSPDLPWLPPWAGSIDMAISNLILDASSLYERISMKRIAILIIAAATSGSVIGSMLLTAGHAGDAVSPIFGVKIPKGYRH